MYNVFVYICVDNNTEYYFLKINRLNSIYGINTTTNN